MSETVDLVALLQQLGLDQITETTPGLPRLAEMLRELGQKLNGIDPLARATVRGMLIDRCRKVKVPGAAALIDAALKPASPPVVEPRPPAPDQVAQWRAEGASVLEHEDILSLVDQYLLFVGYAGETRAPKVLYQSLTSRTFARPVNISLSGPSGAGKNFAIDAILPLHPCEAFYKTGGASPLGLLYSEESFEHRIVIVAESSALHEDGIGASMMRSLIWDAEISYDTVIDGESVRLRKAGPSGLVTTTTARLDPQTATRVWEVGISDTKQQTAKVLHAIARKVAGLANTSVDGLPSVGAFVAAQRWLAAQPKPAIVVPYAPALADLIQPVEVRLRRDFSQLATLIQTNAWLHQLHRERDSQGRIVATLDDYEAIRQLVDPIFETSVHSGVTAALRDTVKKVAQLTAGSEKTVTVSALAQAFEDVSLSAVWGRVKKLEETGYLVNDELRDHRPAKLRVGEPLPPEGSLLPTLEALVERQAIEEENT